MAKILKNDNPQKLNLRTRSMHFVRNTSENWCLPEFNNAILAIHIKCHYNGSWGKKKKKEGNYGNFFTALVMRLLISKCTELQIN